MLVKKLMMKYLLILTVVMIVLRKLFGVLNNYHFHIDHILLFV